MIPRNPILEEIYSAREKLLDDFQGDVHTYIHDARQRALASGRQIATPKARANRSTAVANKGESADENQPFPPVAR
jgi:hypothetical protein